MSTIGMNRLVDHQQTYHLVLPPKIWTPAPVCDAAASRSILRSSWYSCNRRRACIRRCLTISRSHPLNSYCASNYRIGRRWCWAVATSQTKRHFHDQAVDQGIPFRTGEHPPEVNGVLAWRRIHPNCHQTPLMFHRQIFPSGSVLSQDESPG
jgi:hypothetical protein